MSRNQKCRDVDVEIGLRLRKLRLANKLSQTDLGQALGITFQQIQKYENGTNSIAAARMPQLCAILQCTPNDLIPYGENFEAKQWPKLSTVSMRTAINMETLPIGVRNKINNLLNTLVSK